jgi:hypothetical protein
MNWNAIKQVLDHFPPLYCLVWVAKHVSGFFGIGHMMKNWHFWDHSQCPCCHHVEETKEHIMTCPHPACATTWLASLAGLGWRELAPHWISRNAFSLRWQLATHPKPSLPSVPTVHVGQPRLRTRLDGSLQWKVRWHMHGKGSRRHTTLVTICVAQPSNGQQASLPTFYT